MHIATIKFDFPEGKKGIIFNSVMPEISSTGRATTRLSNKDGLSAVIEANDTTALRAAINTLLQMISASEKAVDAAKKS